MCLEILKSIVKDIYEDQKNNGSSIIDITLGWQKGEDILNRVQIEFRFDNGQLSDEIKYYHYKSGIRYNADEEAVMRFVNENYQVDIMNSVLLD